MKQLFAAAACMAVTIAFVPAASAQSSAGQPLRLVVPYAAGGNVDTTARLIAPGLGKLLNQPVIVENKPGAGGMIAATHVMRSVDDNTFFISSNGPILHSPIIFNRPTAYSWKKDFVAVTSVSFTPMVLNASKTLSAKNIRELQQNAKAAPGTITIATPGMGSTNHLMAELLQDELGVKFSAVHYKGTAPATNDLIGGHVMLGFDQVNVALPHIQQGSMRALAVTTSKRLAQMPDVPTLKELGVNVEAASFVGIFAPAGTSDGRVNQIAEAVAKVLADKSVEESFSKQGAQTRAMGPKEFRKYLEQEDAVWLPIIDRAVVKAEGAS